jgi:outer membrane protein OmpA-like peptidoglycan-associated protein
MRVTRLILSGAAISVIAFAHPVMARDDSAPIILAQQEKNQQDKNQDQKKDKEKGNREQRGDQKKEQRQEGRGQDRQQQQQRQDSRKPQDRDQAQERQDQGKQQQKRQQDLQQRDQRKDAKEDQRKDRREDAKEQRKDRREDAKDQRKDQREERRDDAKDQREERRDDAKDQRKDRREDAKDQRKDRREDAKEQSQDKRDQRESRDQRDDRDDRRRLDDVRKDRTERREGNRTIIQEGNRTIVREGNRTIIRRDESDRFRRFGRDVNVQRVGGETRTVVVGPNGQRIVTVTDSNGRLLRRSRFVDGREVIIIDNRPRGGRRADAFFVALPALAIASLAIPRDRYIVEAESAPPEYIYGALMAPPVERLPRAYTLDEIRYSPEVRDRMPRIDLDTITFDSGSWEITPDQYGRLAPIADGIKRAISKNPNEVFLVEGHTDATGTEEDNLSLSDRRAEAVSVILTDQFQIPPENLTTQGYGEQQLKVATEGPERANRRVTMRRITPLLQQGDAAGGAAPQ